MKLAANPMCECGCGRPADTVHHIVPIDVAPDRRLEMDNLMSLTRECHERIERDRGKRRNSGGR